MVMTALERQKFLEDEKVRYVDQGFTIRKMGIGDGVQFTSLPENFFKATGHKLIDVSMPWFMDANPFILRGRTPKKTIELWNYPTSYPWPKLRESVYLSNAEIHAGVFGVKNPALIRPRLYRFEDFPFEQRKTILFHPFGKSHGALPESIIKHVVDKYKKTANLFQIGLPTDPSIGIPRISTPTLWDLAFEISRARMLIGADSGPSWIAACYPDVIVKKVRTRFQYGYCEPKDWVPLDVKNSHSFWDDRVFQIFNTFEEDCGFTYSYKKL